MFENELQIVKKIALEAGEIILNIYKKDFTYYEKEGGQGPVTEADLAANKFICSSLTQHFPNDDIISEENDNSNLKRLNTKRVWCIDPLDGTKDFLLKNGEFAIHIGLIINKKASFGVVYLPAFNKLFYGGSNIGSFKEENGKKDKIYVKNEPNLDNMVMIGTRSHRTEKYLEIINKLNPKKEIIHGSMGCKASFISIGKADYFMYPGSKTKEWDICAPSAIIEGAGGMVTDFDGLPLFFNKKNVNNPNGIIASNGASHDKIIAKLKEIKLSQ